MATLSRTLGPEVRAHMAILSARRYLEGAAPRSWRREATLSN
jgi:hypothetical protein